MTRRVGLEAGFAMLAAAVLVLSVLALGATSGQATTAGAGGLTFDADVPDEYSFDPPTDPGVARIGETEYDSAQAALDDAEPGDTVVLSGRFEERLVLNTPNVTLTSAPGEMAMIDGGGEDDTLTLNGANATVKRVWVHNSGLEASGNDAGIWVNSTNASIVDSRVTDITFGIWVDGVNDITIVNNTIVGREEIATLSYRGNGIQLWKTERAVVKDNAITDVRDGIYYSFAEHVVTTNNTMWDLRYGVHFMYSDDCRLADNIAFDNDVGYALMVSVRLELSNNVAVNNTGTSGHGILVKDIDDTTIDNNTLVGNDKGIYVYNSLNNTIARNLVLENAVGVQLSAGSTDERVYENSFIHNDVAVLAVTSQQISWNASDHGNYWSGTQPVDLDRDGVSEVRHRPAGLVEHLVYEHPQASVFANSPAFDAMRLAQSSFPVIESPGVVDHYPLTEPPHEDWRRYYARD